MTKGRFHLSGSASWVCYWISLELVIYEASIRYLWIRIKIACHPIIFGTRFKNHVIMIFMGRRFTKDGILIYLGLTSTDRSKKVWIFSASVKMRLLQSIDTKKLQDADYLIIVDEFLTRNLKPSLENDFI